MVLKTNSRLPEYEPLADRHLRAFIDKASVQKQLQKLGLARSNHSHSPSIELQPKGTLPKLARESELREQYTVNKPRAQSHLTGRALSKE
jgi:hypothetical protein